MIDSSVAQQQGQGGEVLLQIKGDLATVFLGSADEQVIMLTERRLISLANAVQESVRQGAKGMVFIGPHDQMFCAGTDIEDLVAMSHPKGAEELSRQVQQLFELIAGLPITTVSAISGSCLGGGTELALACKYRLITGLASSKIGLPEIQLGILPSFGGTQRLPRLLGLPKALEIILQGKILNSNQAFRYGLVDQIIGNSGVSPYAALKQVASELALGRINLPQHRPSIRERFLTSTSVGRSFVIPRVQAEIELRGRGHYPAPGRALNAICVGLKSGQKAGLEEEAKAIGELAVSSECKSLLHIYSLRENSKRVGKPLQEEVRAAHVAIVGAGVSGEAIAVSALASGNKVIVFEADSKVRDRIHSSLEQAVVKMFGSNGRVDLDEVKCRISVVDKLSALSAADIVIETVGEDSELKRKVFREISGAVRRDAVLASHTSSLSVSDFAREVDNPGRVIGMHFFHPMSKINLVELVRAEKTSTKTLVYAASFATHLGKFPIIVEDSPGFVVNRVLAPYLIEAMYLLSEGYTVSSIDSAAESFGMSMGPFRLLDEIGLDVALEALEKLNAAFGDRMSGYGFLHRLVEKGRIGRKTGLGFYKYHNDEFSVDPTLEESLGVNKKSEFNSTISRYLEDRLMLPMINEAVRVLDDGIAGAPGRDAAGQIDLGSVLGFGFAPFRGGVLRYANSLGADNIEEFLDNFARNVGPRFKPCSGIMSRASRGESFL